MAPDTPPETALPSRLLLSATLIFFITASSVIAWRTYNIQYDDLPSFYWGTQLAFEQQSPYRSENFKPIQREQQRKIYPFLYPPPSLLVFSPLLACSDYGQCKAVFSALNLALWWLFALVMLQLYRHLSGSRSPWPILLIPCWLLLFMPIINTLKTGQINLIAILLVLPLCFLTPHSSRRRQWLAGLGLALALMLKLYLALLVIPLLLARQWTVLTAFGTAFVALLISSYLLLPAGLWSDWLALSSGHGGYGKQLPYVMTIPWNQSINGFFIRHFLDAQILNGQNQLAVPIYLVCLSVLAVAAFACWQAIRKFPNGHALACGLILLTINLVAPLTWLHHYVFAAVAIIAGFSLLQTMAYPKARTALFGLFSLLLSLPFLLVMPFPSEALNITNNHIPLGQNLLLSSSTIAASGVFCLIIWFIMSPRKQL